MGVVSEEGAEVAACCFCFTLGWAALCRTRKPTVFPPPRIVSGDGESDVGKSGIRSGAGEEAGFAIGSGVCRECAATGFGVADGLGGEGAVFARRALSDFVCDGEGRERGEGDGLGRREAVAVGWAEFSAGLLAGEGAASGKSTSTASFMSGEAGRDGSALDSVWG